MSLAPCFNLAWSSWTVNLLDDDFERSLALAAGHSRIWNGNFVRELQVGTSSLSHFLQATDLSLNFAEFVMFAFACFLRQPCLSLSLRTDLSMITSSSRSIFVVPVLLFQVLTL